jgi:anti-sigma B factor antagonist
MNLECENMEISQTTINDVPVISVSGRIDAATSRDLETVLNGLIEQDRSMIVLDLGGVEYVSSVGLRVMLAALKKVKPKKGDLLLASMQPFVKEVFEITGFTRLFGIYPSQAEALLHVKSH